MCEVRIIGIQFIHHLKQFEAFQLLIPKSRKQCHKQRKSLPNSLTGLTNHHHHKTTSQECECVVVVVLKNENQDQHQNGEFFTLVQTAKTERERACFAKPHVVFLGRFHVGGGTNTDTVQMNRCPNQANRQHQRNQNEDDVGALFPLEKFQSCFATIILVKRMQWLNRGMACNAIGHLLLIWQLHFLNKVFAKTVKKRYLSGHFQCRIKILQNNDKKLTQMNQTKIVRMKMNQEM